MERVLSAPLYLLLAGLGLASAALPRRLELVLGTFFGRAALTLGLFKWRLAEQHLELCFPELGPDARARLLRANFEHYGVLFFQFTHFFCPLPGHYRRYAGRISRLDGYENWKRASDKGKGVLFFSSHVGWWEMSAAAGALAGIKPTVVTTVLKPGWLDRKITAERSSCGITAAYHPGSMPSVLRCLRKGGTVAFMNDQYAPPPMGAPVRFFGAMVDTLTVVGPLAKRTGAAIVPVSVHRDRDGVEVVTIEPELELGEAAGDATAATTRIAAHIEGWVRRHPEQWLWIHRRFKRCWSPLPAAAAPAPAAASPA